MRISTVRRFLPFALSLWAVLVLGVLAGPAAASPPTHTTLNEGAARSFWTPQRMARAVPLDRPADELRVQAKAARGGAVPPFVSEPVPDPTLLPYPAVGKVFFKIDGGIFVCSASVTDAPSRSLVWTAGHCVRDAGRRGEFAKKWVFVPGYDQGARPYGAWPASELWANRGWIKNNQHFDFAAAVIPKQNGTALEAAVGGGFPLGVNSAYDQLWQAIGYPESPHWHQMLWHCVSPLYRVDRFSGSGPSPFGIGCDMTGGSSGGPWINEAGELGAVTSYGYRNQPDALYGTYLGSAAGKLYNKIRNRAG